jgi:hypothetical protein
LRLLDMTFLSYPPASLHGVHTCYHRSFGPVRVGYRTRGRGPELGPWRLLASGGRVSRIPRHTRRARTIQKLRPVLDGVQDCLPPSCRLHPGMNAGARFPAPMPGMADQDVLKP